MATLKQRMHKKNSSGSYDTVHLETSSSLVLRPSGRTVEQDLADYLPKTQASDTPPSTLKSGSMVTGLSKAWIGINNVPSELNMGTGRKETVLYDHTVNANIDLTDSGGADEYYQIISFPDYIAAVGDEHYDYIYTEYAFIGDAYGTPIDYNSYKHAYARADIIYANTILQRINYSNIGGSTFYFNKLSGKSTLITRGYGIYGTNTYTGFGTGIVDFNIYAAQYHIEVKLGYGYTQSSWIHNNNNIQHRVRIVGVI